MTIANNLLPDPPEKEREENQKNVDRLVYVVILVLTFLAAARSPIDSDLWWHLRGGQVTWLTGKPLITDLFSFTQYGQQWINHSWLSEVIIYLIYRWGGYLGLGTMVAVTATLCMAIIYKIMDGPALFKALLIVPGILVAAWVWTPRPQLFSQLLVAVLCMILYQYKWHQKDWLWSIPLMFILWSNLHGGYPLGLLVIGFLMVGEVLNHILGYQGKEIIPWKGVGKLFLVFLISFLVVIINPNGINMWKIPLQTVDVSIIQFSISEWASPDFHDFAQQPFIWLLLGTFLAVGMTRRHLDGADFCMTAGFAYLSLYSRRAFGPFALVAMPVLARYLWLGIQEWEERTQLSEKWGRLNLRIKGKANSQDQPPERVRKIINFSIVALLGLAAMIKLIGVTYPAWIDMNIQKAYPVAALQIMNSYQEPGNVFNEYNWGGFQIWNSQSDKVFVDGRTDLYLKDKNLSEWTTFIQAGLGWKEIYQKYPLDWILLQPDRPILKELPAMGWRIVYQDDMAVLMKRQ